MNYKCIVLNHHQVIQYAVIMTFNVYVFVAAQSPGTQLTPMGHIRTHFFFSAALVLFIGFLVGLSGGYKKRLRLLRDWTCDWEIGHEIESWNKQKHTVLSDVLELFMMKAGAKGDANRKNGVMVYSM